MELRDLQALRAVVMSGTTKGAALGLGVSQPTISRSITQIEAALGRSIFTRQKGRLIPTKLALQISQRVEAIDSILDALQREITESEGDGVFRIGINADCCGPVLHRVIRQFRTLYPNVGIHLEASGTSNFSAAISGGDLDLGITMNPVIQEQVNTDLLLECDMCCIVPSGHRLAQLDVIQADDLKNADVIAVFSENANCEQMSALQFESNAALRSKIVVSSARIAYDLVAAGLGIAIVSPLPFVAGSREAPVEFKRLSPQLQARLFSLIAPGSPRYQMARQFCRMFRNVTYAADPVTAVREPVANEPPSVEGLPVPTESNFGFPSAEPIWC